jgi:hypothetical protein
VTSHWLALSIETWIYPRKQIHWSSTYVPVRVGQRRSETICPSSVSVVMAESVATVVSFAG